MGLFDAFSDSDLRAELARRHEQGEVSKRDAALGVARDMILRAADFTCVHDRGKDHPMKWNPYCSDCPVSPIGNYEEYGARSQICGRTRNYPQ